MAEQLPAVAPVVASTPSARPSVGGVLRAGLADLSADWAGVMKAGVTGSVVFLVYATLAGLLGVPVFPVAMYVTARFEEELVFPVVTLVLWCASMGVVSAPFASSFASILRACHAAQEGRSRLSWSTPLRPRWSDLGGWSLVCVAYAVTVGVGTFVGLVPALAAMVLLDFAMPAMVVHRLPWWAAVHLSAAHGLRNPGWRLGFAAVTLAASIVVPCTPLLLLYLPAYFFVLLRAYKAWFGAGPVPVAVSTGYRA